MSEEVKIEITADSASAEPALKGTAAGVATISTASKAAAPAVRGLAGTIDTLRLSLTTLQKAFALLGIITLAISWLTALWGVCKTVYGWFKKLEDTSASEAIDRMAASAKAAADEWKKLNEEMVRNAAQRKALADDVQKQADASYALGVANIEEKLQKNLASTTDPALRATYQAEADASKARLANQSKVTATRAARANAEADLLQNERDIATARKTAEANAKPLGGAPKTPEDAKKYAKAQDDAYAVYQSSMAAVKKLQADRTRLQAAYVSTNTRVAEAEALNRAGMTQAEREVYDRTRAASEASAAAAAAQATASASKASATPAPTTASTASRRADIIASAADKSRSVTVDAPRAASSAGSIGGITGGVLPNSLRLAEQRAAALEAIQRESVRLLSQINTKLEE
jgi:chemotaxis protein histidine kinase CheA